MRRIGLGQEPVYQTWIEIPNFATLDKWAEHTKSKEWTEISSMLFSQTEGFSTAVVHELL